MIGRWTCARCGEPIGLWEPARFLTLDGDAVETSPLQLPPVQREQVVDVSHVACLQP